MKGIKETRANWRSEIIIGLLSLVSITVLIWILQPLDLSDRKNIAMNLLAEVFGILITAGVIDLLAKRREKRLNAKHLNLLIAHNLDRFQVYLEDISDVLDELNKDKESKFIFERLKRILLNANSKPLFQFFTEHNLTAITGSAVSIVVEIEGKTKGAIDFSKLGLSSVDIIKLRSRILHERMDLVKSRGRYEKLAL